MSAPTPIDDVLGRLEGVRKDGSGWSARCPCRNDDHNPSLHVGLGDDDRVLLTCHRGGGCDLDAICTAIGLSVIDLHPTKFESRPGTTPKAKPARKSDGGTKPAPSPAPSPAKSAKLTLTDTWNYYDPAGVLVFQKRRFVDEDGKKTFRQRQPNDAGGWINNLTGIEPVLYRLPQVLAAKSMGDTIWVTEGEKDADTVVAQGFEATTLPGGAGKWRDSFTESLVGAHQVIVVADNDGPGLTHALEVGRRLEAAGVPVWLAVPPVPHKDVSDLIGAGGTLDDLVALEPVATDANLTVEESPPDLEPPEPAETLDDFYANLTVEETDADADNWGELTDALHAILHDPDLSAAQRVVRATRILERHLPDDDALPLSVLRWAEFVNGQDDPYDWLIPEVLERGERVIVVAEEGAGKTFLMRQVALCAAAGIHPFTRAQIPPIRTLTIDLENPERIIRRTSRQIVDAVRLFTKRSPDADLVIRPAGLNLLKAQDRRFVERAIEETQPDLVCMGPLYKSFVDPGGRTSESIAVEVAKYLDELRDAYGISWWLEHHAPLGDSMRSRDLRPFGSAVWSRWPEFGLALHHDPTEPDDYVYEVKHFRGGRDARRWPTRMKRGSKGNLPFEVIQYMHLD